MPHVKKVLDSSTSSQEPLHSVKINRRDYSPADKKSLSSGNQGLSELQGGGSTKKKQQEGDSQMKKVLEKLGSVVEQQRETQESLTKIYGCSEENKKVAKPLLGLPRRGLHVHWDMNQVLP